MIALKDPSMEMRRLEVFCKVVELKSFTKAAEALQLSQPTVSEHIRALEAVLEEKMIDRLGREASATPAGRIFYEYARNILRIREQALQALAQFRGELSGRLMLGAGTIPGAYVLPKLIASFKRENPNVRITLRVSDSAEIAGAVLEGSIEAGVVGLLPTDKRLVLEELFSDELVLAVHPGHPWAGIGKIDPADLRNEPFIVREPGSGTRTVMNRILREHGFDTSELDVVAEMGSNEAVLQGIKQRIGASVLSRQAVDEYLDCGSVTLVEIDGVRFLRPLCLIRRKGRQASPLCAAFLDFLRESAPPSGKK
jgi:DNA-binding transcriptional LysR family regulator